MRILLHFTQVFIGQCQLRVVEQDNKFLQIILTCESFHKGGYFALLELSSFSTNSEYILTSYQCFVYKDLLHPSTNFYARKTKDVFYGGNNWHDGIKP